MQALGVAQQRGDQHHHLLDALADHPVLVAITAYGRVVQPEGDGEQDVGGGGFGFRGAGAHHAGLDQSADDVGDAFATTFEDAREMQAQLA